MIRVKLGNFPTKYMGRSIRNLHFAYAKCKLWGGFGAQREADGCPAGDRMGVKRRLCFY